MRAPVVLVSMLEDREIEVTVSREEWPDEGVDQRVRPGPRRHDDPEAPVLSVRAELDGDPGLQQ